MLLSRTLLESSLTSWVVNWFYP